MSTLQPRSQPGHTDGVVLRYQTRALYSDWRGSRAPTGQMSTMLSEYGSWSSGWPPAGRISEWSPRFCTPRALDFETSRVKRTQRVHRMQRSLSSVMRSLSA